MTNDLTEAHHREGSEQWDRNLKGPQRKVLVLKRNIQNQCTVLEAESEAIVLKYSVGKLFPT